MRFLLTGAAGFIGSAVARQLAGTIGHDVLVLDKLTYAGNLNSLASVRRLPNFEFLKADVCDRDAVTAAFARFQPDVVMHLAAETHVDRSIDGPADFMQTNVVGAFVMLEAAYGFWRSLDEARAARFRYLHISTDEVFGALGPTGAFHEESPYAPNSPYAATKAASDHLVRAWRETYGLPTIVTNCSNNYGPFHFPEKLIPLSVIRALEGKPILVYGKGLNVRDWLYVEDHAEALARVACAGVVGQSYNVGGRSERRNIDVVHAICDLLDELSPRPDGASYRGQIAFVEDRPGHDLRYAIDCSKIERELGWRAKETFESGLRKTVQWYLDNRDWWNSVRDGSYQGERLGCIA